MLPATFMVLVFVPVVALVNMAMLLLPFTLSQVLAVAHPEEVVSQFVVPGRPVLVSLVCAALAVERVSGVSSSTRSAERAHVAKRSEGVGLNVCMGVRFSWLQLGLESGFWDG